MLYQTSYSGRVHATIVFCFLIAALRSARGIYVDYIVSSAFDRADHFGLAFAASYSYPIILVLQARDFRSAVRAKPGINLPVIRHRLAPYDILRVRGIST